MPSFPTQAFTTTKTRNFKPLEQRPHKLQVAYFLLKLDKTLDLTMKNLPAHITIALLLSLLFSPVAFANSQLTKLAKTDTKDVVQVFFSFDRLPRSSYKLNKKRLDVILENTTSSENLKLFEPDDKIIKILPTGGGNRTVVSFFFRYHPQKVKIEPTRDGKLVAEVLLGNRYSRSYQDLSERLKGLTVVERETIDVGNPLGASPYKDNWRSFFSRYEAEISISVPIDFTVPPFPIIALIPPNEQANVQLIPDEVMKLADQEVWDDTQPILLERLQQTASVEHQKLLALTHGEVLFRQGDFESAYKQLYLLANEYRGEHTGIVAKYLLTLMQAIYEDPYLADSEYKTLENLVTPKNPLAPYYQLSRIEVALATLQFPKMKRLLERDDIPYPGETHKLRELRLGDYYTAAGDFVRSFVSYEMLKNSDILRSHPFSLNGYCNSLYSQNKFELAAACYQQLGPQVSDNDALGLISYRKSMAELHLNPDAANLVDSFARIEDAFPGTEAGFRAALKQTDLKYLANPSWGGRALKFYHALAETAVLRSPTAEAAFKKALLSHLMDDTNQSVELLMDFLRDFQMSELRETATALLIDLLPGEIRRRIDEELFMEALILAKRNVKIFQNQWIDTAVFADIAHSYQKIGIFSEAQKVYLYLIEVIEIEKREQFFLPLIQSVFDQGEYGLVEDFASLYFYNYPSGKDTDDILLLRLKALVASERFKEARELLPEPLTGQPSLMLLAANLYFRDNDFPLVLDAIDKLGLPAGELDTVTLYMCAESKFRLGDYEGASSLFPLLADSTVFEDQATYRMAELARHRGLEENALKLFERIVEKGNDSLWRKYAEKELEYSRIMADIEKMIDG